LNALDTVNEFALNSTNAISILYDNELYSHALVQLYASIDVFGLLNAQATQKSATQESFKNWVNEYMVKDHTLTINAFDLWAARCAVLHTHSSESGYSRKGDAKELVYFVGNTNTEEVQENISAVNSLDHASSVSLEGLIAAYCDGVSKFIQNIEALINENEAYTLRINNVLKSQF